MSPGNSRLAIPNRYRWLAGVLVTGLVAALPVAAHAQPAHGVTSHVPVPRAAQPDRPDVRTAAQAKALRSGRAVPIGALTTATSTTVANPDGTFATTTSAQPTRVRAAGKWVPIDATLKRNPDGSIRTVATTNKLTLSAGGRSAFATVVDNAGHSFGLELPAALPAPSLAGPVATYRNVYRGVDLVVTAQNDGGFREVFVAHDASAATRIRTVRFTTHLTGLRLHADAAGDLQAVDSRAGRVVVAAPPAAMWDSARAGALAHRVSDQDPPAMGAHIAKVPVAVDTAGLTLTARPGAHPVYPLYVDPTWSLPGQSGGTQAYTQTQSGCPSYTYFDNVSQPGVGYNDYDSCVGKFRSFFQINTSNLLNPAYTIRSATLKINEVYSALNSCGQGSETITIYSTSPINANTDWSNQPLPGANITSKAMTSVGNGNGTRCSGGTVPGDFNVISGVNLARTNNWGNWTLVMVGNESAGSHSLERFNNNPSIVTIYDVKPNTPTNLTATPKPVDNTGAVTQGCGTAAAGYLGLSNLAGAHIATLSATLTSAVSAAQMYGSFTLHDDTTGSTVGTYNSSGYATTGATVSVQTPTLTDGHQYSWWVQANDQYYPSPTSATCKFIVDQAAPSNPVISSDDFPESGTGKVPTKTTGQPGTLTLSAAEKAPASGTGSGMKGYRYSFDTPLPVDVNSEVSTYATGLATIGYTPGAWGTHTLYVESVDNAGNVSGQSQYSFYVPWNKTTTIQPGDVNSDGIPDLLTANSNGDLAYYAGNHDPAAPVVASTAAQSPDGKSWSKFQITHRGSFHNGAYDDLWAFNTLTKHLYLYTSNGSATGEQFTNAGGSDTSKALDVTKQFIIDDAQLDSQVAPDTVAPNSCASSPTSACGCHTTLSAPGSCATWNHSDWSTLTQALAVGDFYQGSTVDTTGNNDLLTVEGDALWLYEGQPSPNYLGTAIQLGSSGWTGMTLLAPGLVGGQPTLWARDATGNIYGYPITFDANGYPQSLGTPSTADTAANLIATGYKTAKAPAVASPGDTSGDGYPDLYSTDATGHLWLTPGVSGGGLATTRSLAGSVAQPTEAWSLADASCTTAASATGRTNASAHGGVSCGTSVTDAKGVAKPAFGFNGTDADLTTAGPVLNTTADFTVSAWVNLAKTSTTSNFEAVSQAGIADSGFVLGYHESNWLCGGGQSWWFWIPSADAPGAGGTCASSATNSVATNTWTMLTGVYSASSGTMSLYVNGALAGTAKDTAPWNSSGALAIGNMHYNNTAYDWFPGHISDVRVSNTALTASQVAAVYNGTAAITQLS
jgi:hypothetical protein